MSKSILVIDTPENCYNCGIRRGYSCGGVSGTFGTGKDIDDFRLHKPDWCPLKEFPKKKPKVKYQGNGCFGINEAMKNSFNAGFNACIDEILKGDGEE